MEYSACGVISGEVDLQGEPMPGVYLGDVYENPDAYADYVNNEVFAGALEYWDITTQIVAEYLHNVTLQVYEFNPVQGNALLPEVRKSDQHEICRRALYPILHQLDFAQEVYPVNPSQSSAIMKLLFYITIHHRGDNSDKGKKRERGGGKKGKKARGGGKKGKAKAGSGSGEREAHYDLIVNIAYLDIQ